MRNDVARGRLTWRLFCWSVGSSEVGGFSLLLSPSCPEQQLTTVGARWAFTEWMNRFTQEGALAFIRRQIHTEHSGKKTPNNRETYALQSCESKHRSPAWGRQRVGPFQIYSSWSGLPWGRCYRHSKNGRHWQHQVFGKRLDEEGTGMLCMIPWKSECHKENTLLRLLGTFQERIKSAYLARFP